MLYYAILKMKSNINSNLNNNLNNSRIYNNLFGINKEYNQNNDNIILKTPDEILKSNFSIPLDLKDLYKDIKIDVEALDLLRTLGTRWYKCPNGHLYVVGECGGPMQESICPECRAMIGGLNHVPANWNSVVDLNAEMRNLSINNENRIRNPLLNQDQEAQNNMNQQQNRNQEHHMDDDIRELVNRHPEMNNYY